MLTAERARELLSHDENTGKLFWRVNRRGRAKAGDEAGSVWRDPRSQRLSYRLIGVDCRDYKAHRVVWLISHGEWPPDQIDHIDGDGLNNRLSNLRSASRSVNQRNATRHRYNTSGVTGVSWDKPTEKWLAQIMANGKKLHLGRFDSFDDAISARKAAERKHGFHPSHGRAAA